MTEGAPAAPLATWQDVQARWRSLTAEEQGVATARIADASALLRILVPDIDARGAVDSNLAASTTATVVNAVLRVLQNPAGAKQLQESAGPFSHSMTLDAGSTGVFFTDDELQVLRPSVAAISTSYVGVRPQYARSAPYPKRDAWVGGPYGGGVPWGEISRPWWW